MKKYNFVAPCHFGIEAVLKREIQDLGYDIVKVEDGRVTFEGDISAVCRANVFLRTAERVLLQVGRVKATTYDELFEAVKAMDWEEYIPEDGKFWVKKASSIKSKLFSPSDIQRIVKKAMVEKLKLKYRVNRFAETGNEYPLRVVFYKDEAIIALDTSGDSLHKRGYRKNTAKANIATGMNREFTAENWDNLIEKKLWYDAINEANDMINDDIEVDIQGYDIDGEVVEFARKNAELAGVDHLIHFQRRPVSELRHSKKYGFIITNPPYGERLEEKEQLPPIYQALGRQYKALDSWSAFVITSYEDTEKYMGLKATKNRKIYNGMIKTYFYQFMGPKPPKKKENLR